MKCPKCQYEPTMREMQVSPGTCPSCGVIYEKYLRARESKNTTPESGQKKPVTKVTKLRAAINGEFIDENAQCVVVTDIRMRFWSMVIFMVKWALASIPALIILGVIFMLLGSSLLSIFGR